MIDRCWSTIGVRGDATCPELKERAHCHNCPVFAGAALGLLERELPSDHLAQWTGHVARERPIAQRDTHSVVVFRLASEWLALPTTFFIEIADSRPIHSLPNRSGDSLLGLVNIRGELLICVSLHRIFGLKNDSRHDRSERSSGQRLLVLEHDRNRTVCLVDEAYGVARFNGGELTQTPATLARAVGTFTKAVLPWHDKAVGLLDEELLFHTLDGSLASTRI